jgi:hypothetical protein
MNSIKSVTQVSRSNAKSSLIAEPNSGPVIEKRTMKPVNSQTINPNYANSYSGRHTSLAGELTNQSKLVSTMDLRPSQLSTVSLPSLGGKRRVH